MPKTQITAHFTVPTTSMSRIQDLLGDVVKVVEDHKGSTPLVTIHGPIPDDFNGGENGNEGRRNPDVGRRNERRDEQQAEDDASSADGEPAKRGRGRPRKSDGDAAPSRSSGGSGQRGRSSGSDAEDDSGNEPQRTRKGAGKADREGAGRNGSAERGRGSERGNREASRVTEDTPDDDWGGEENTGEDAEDWGEEDDAYEANQAKLPGDTNWPDDLTPETIDKSTITTLLGDHFQATGGKDRGLTFDLMEKVTKSRQLNKVDERDYDDLARALLKDIARYKHGIKKAK